MKYYNHGDKLKYLFNSKSAEENMVEIFREQRKATMEQLQERKRQQEQQKQADIDNKRLNEETLQTATKAIEEQIKKIIK